MKTLILASALAVVFVAVAGGAEVQKDKAPAPTMRAKTMSDAELDKVTAGMGVNTTFGGGVPHIAAACGVAAPGAICSSQSTGGSPSSHATSPGRGTGAVGF